MVKYQPRGFHLVAALLTAFAFMHHAMLMRAPTNDNFMHLALARQLMAGDLPIRDFFDSGLGLTYVLSAVAESIVGYRLLSEALLVGAAWAISTWLVFTLVRRLTGVVLALIATHGLRPRTVSRCVVAGGVTLALVTPFLVYAQVVDGLPDYVRAEIAQSVYENESAGVHKWPLTDLPDRFLRLDAHARTSEMTAALFTWLAVLAIVIAATPLRRRLPKIGSGASLGGVRALHRCGRCRVAAHALRCPCHRRRRTAGCAVCLVLARNDRAPLGEYGPRRWPCYAPPP